MVLARRELARVNLESTALRVDGQHESAALVLVHQAGDTLRPEGPPGPRSWGDRSSCLMAVMAAVRSWEVMLEPWAGKTRQAASPISAT